MPTKIVSGRSNPQNGEISQQDLNRIVQDFENFVSIESTVARAFTKIDTISIPILILDRLLAKVSPAQRPVSTIDIKFGITLPDQRECKDVANDISNHLTVVLMINRAGKEVQNQVDDFIITPGFKEFNEGANEAVCCPLITP